MILGVVGVGGSIYPSFHNIIDSKRNKECIRFTKIFFFSLLSHFSVRKSVLICYLLSVKNVPQIVDSLGD